MGLLVGSAVGALGNAAVSHGGVQAAGNPPSANWPGPGALPGAVVLVAVTWGISVLAATRRDNWTVGGTRRGAG